MTEPGGGQAREGARDDQDYVLVDGVAPSVIGGAPEYHDPPTAPIPTDPPTGPIPVPGDQRKQSWVAKVFRRG
jgi:hypothetical protein